MRTGHLTQDDSTSKSIDMQHHGCRVCGVKRLKSIFTARGWPLVQCINCGFVQVSDRPTEDDLAAVYNDAYFSHSKYRDLAALERENVRRLDLLRRFLPVGAQLLDAGCSTGDFVRAAHTDYEMWGFDLSAYAIESARQKNPELAERLWAGKLEEFGEKTPLFDAVCLWDVIEHVWDPVDVCKKLFQRLKPGGLLFLSTPSIDAPVAKIMGKYWAFMTPPEHLGFFSKQSFCHFFSTAVEGEILHHERRGKWANIAFIAYKVRRIAPMLMPQIIVNALGASVLGRLAIYVPTGDIQYLVVRKC